MCRATRPITNATVDSRCRRRTSNTQAFQHRPACVWHMNVTARRTDSSCPCRVAATDRHCQNAPESVLCSMCSTLRRVTAIR
eukprot:395523-Prymnesium_polylepis.1